MLEQIVRLLACPVCGKPLVFNGKGADHRLVSGCLACDFGHMYQVKEEIAILKDAKLSAQEFEWKVDVADEKKYDEIRKEYDSYFREDQKAATQKMIQRLVDLVTASCTEPDNVILDAATGMGTFILSLAKQSSRMLIVGTDIDEKPLRGVMNKAKRAGLWDRQSVIVTDAKRLSFKDSSLSTISSYFGFDNVPQTTLAFRESARVLRFGGRMYFSSLWLAERSKSMRLAEKYNVCQIASETRLKNTLAKAGFALEKVEEIYSGIWPHNPMDLLPVEGDEYRHVIVQAKKWKD